MKQFLKIYLWQIISLVSGFATMFVVTPFLASKQNYFGIYTFIVSLNLFLSYADFGFLNAGAKFASEAYARNERAYEIKILGFVFFILSVVFILFGLLIIIFCYQPNYILKGLDSEDKLILAKELFVVFIFSLPILLAQRAVQLIFNIRLQDHLFQRIYSLFNILKILFVFFFFTNDSYHIVEYYSFTQLLTLVSVVIALILAKKRFNYDLKALLKAIRFNRNIYEKTNKLAFNSLFVTISWILYYELDSLIIGKFVGLREVAIFNICISVMTLARTLYAIVYNPFAAKFNHFIGKDELSKLKDVFNKIVVIGLPLSVIPTTILVLTMKNFIYTWVGSDYKEAIPIVTIMFASYFFTFISNPTSILMVAIQKIRSLYLISAIVPIIYWVGIIVFFQSYGLLTFGVFKFMAFLVSAIFYAYIIKNAFGFSWKIFFFKNILPSIITVLLLILFYYIVGDYLPIEKTKQAFLMYALLTALFMSLGFISYYLLTKEFRSQVKLLIKELLKTKV